MYLKHREKKESAEDKGESAADSKTSSSSSKEPTTAESWEYYLNQLETISKNDKQVDSRVR